MTIFFAGKQTSGANQPLIKSSPKVYLELFAGRFIADLTEKDVDDFILARQNYNTSGIGRRGST